MSWQWFWQKTLSAKYLSFAAITSSKFLSLVLVKSAEPKSGIFISDSQYSCQICHTTDGFSVMRPISGITAEQIFICGNMSVKWENSSYPELSHNVSWIQSPPLCKFHYTVSFIDNVCPGCCIIQWSTAALQYISNVLYIEHQGAATCGCNGEEIWLLLLGSSLWDQLLQSTGNRHGCQKCSW